jgi:anti-sigma regulatory factor (Ser/Thr protein kinase)
MPYPNYGDHHTLLVGGDILFLYTDGLIERRGEPLRTGLERLVRAAAGAEGVTELCDRVARDLLPDGGSSDDVAMVALQHERVPEHLSLRFPAQPGSLSGVRRALRRWLHELGAGANDVSMLTLAAGEACTNAVEHAYGPTPAAFALDAGEHDRVVTIIVRDGGQWRSPRGTNRGRGLTIMESAVDELDVRRTAEGTAIVMRRRLRESG